MAEELRERLRTVDISAPSITSAANAMMKHYDKSTTNIAVTEWRNVLFTSNTEQYIPLLYVANEVLQNSKRNRGSKFLESFSPILLQSLLYMVQQYHQNNNTDYAIQMVEKIRRVIKIWDQRRVFSTRYVMDLLNKLEPYRTAQQHISPSVTAVNNHQSSNSNNIDNEIPVATFSPPTDSNNTESTSQQQPPPQQQPISHDDILSILEAHDREKYKRTNDSSDQGNFNDDENQNDNDDDEEYENDQDDDDDDDDLFNDSLNDRSMMMMGDDSEQHPSLSIDVNMNDAVANLVSKNNNINNGKRKIGMNTSKRRRSSTSTTTGKRTGIEKRNSNKITLSNSHFLDIWNRLVENQQRYEIAINTIQQINQRIVSISNDELANLVGDALQQAVQQNELDIKRLVQQKRMLHTLANERHVLGLEAMRYIPWLEASIQQDNDDIQFSTILQEKIRQFIPICKQLQTTRTIVRQEQQRLEEINAEKLRRQKEQEENERFKRDVLSMQTEAKPGMVWNPTTREYQALNTDESWRD